MKALSLLVAILFLSALFPVTTAADEEEQTTIHSFDVSFDDYYDTSAELYADLLEFENDYPDIVENYELTDMIPAGQTWQGNEIYAVKISDNVANEPEYYDNPEEDTSLIIGGQHGRDWMPVSTAMYYVYYLTHYYGMEPTDNDGDGLVNEDWIDGVDNDGDGEKGGRVDEYNRSLFDGIDNDGDGLIDEGIDEDIIEERVTYIVDNYEIWIIPLLNPDGYNYDREDPNRFWRKNMRDNDNDDRVSDCDGVDLNRNFPLHWGNFSNSVSYALDSTEGEVVVDPENPCSDVYIGPQDDWDNDGDGLIDEDDDDYMGFDSDGDGLIDEDRSGGFSEPETQVIEYLFWRLDIHDYYWQKKYLDDYQNGTIRNNWPDMYVQDSDGAWIDNYRTEGFSSFFDRLPHNIKSAVSYHSFGSSYIIPGSDLTGGFYGGNYHRNTYDNLLSNLSVVGYGYCVVNCAAGGAFIDWALYSHQVFSLAVQLNSGNQGGVEGGFHADPVLIQPTSRMHLLTNIEILDDYQFMNNYTHTIEEEEEEETKPEPKPDLPVAFAGKDVTVIEGEVVQFSGAGTRANGSIVLYEWDFDGDGIFEWSSEDNGISTFFYNDGGEYFTTLRVTDNEGNTAVDNRTVTVIADITEGQQGRDEGESSLPSVSMIPALISIGLIARYRRK